MNPAANWQRASLRMTRNHRDAVARIIGTPDPFAGSPFALVRVGGSAKLAICLNPPPLFDVEKILRWHDSPDGDVVLVGIDSGNTTLAGADDGWLLGGNSDLGNDAVLFTNGLHFARAWAKQRQLWMTAARGERAPFRPANDPPHGLLPGWLVAGSVARVTSWAPLLALRRVTVDHPGMVFKVAAALRLAAPLPLVVAAKPPLKMAA
jgi:hypothetical protein